MHHLCMLAKYWEPGRAKTRLARSIGAVSAARLARTFVETTLNRLGDAGHTRTISVWPSDARATFTALAGDDWSVAVQPEGDLGARMEDTFERAWARGASRHILVGSDTPHLNPDWVDQAFEALRWADVVLGPTRDRGYYLVGARQGRTPPIFHNVVWSTPEVWPATVKRLEASGLCFHVLPPTFDVDEWSDLLDLHALLRCPQSWGADPVDDPSLQSLSNEVAAAVSHASTPDDGTGSISS